MDRPQAAEIGPRQIEVQRRKGELQGEPQPGGEADEPPEHRGDHPCANDRIVVARAGFLRLPQGGTNGACEADDAEDQEEKTVNVKGFVLGARLDQQRIDGSNPEQRGPKPAGQTRHNSPPNVFARNYARTNRVRP